MGGQNIQEVRELEDRLPEAGTPEGSLTAINSLPTMEAFTDLSYLKTFYMQGHRSARWATSRASMEHSSDEEADDRGHRSELAGIPKASLHLGMRLHPNRLSPRPPLETTDIAGVFYLFIAS